MPREVAIELDPKPYIYDGMAKGKHSHSITFSGCRYGSKKFNLYVYRTFVEPYVKGKRRKDVIYEVEAGYGSKGKVIPPRLAEAAIEAAKALIEKCKPSPNAKRVTMRQEDGDDGYCYAVRVDGRLVWDAGMTRSEASWRRQNEIDRLDKGLTR